MNLCTVEGVTSNGCATCGIPWDAGYFDESRVIDLQITTLNIGEELVLARYQLHRNYCGVLMSFAQFTDAYAKDNSRVLTPGYQWQVKVNGLPRDPYLTLDHILNPWGQSGMPVNLRLEEGSLVEITIQNVDVARTIPPITPDPRELLIVGGRITGRFWYNTDFGGRPNRL
jgi:hypothetical protein